MAEDSSIEYELNEYDILDEDESPDIEQVFVFAEDDDSDGQISDGNFSITFIAFLFGYFHLFFFSLLVHSRNVLGRRASRKWDGLIDDCTV